MVYVGRDGYVVWELPPARVMSARCYAVEKAAAICRSWVGKGEGGGFTFYPQPDLGDLQGDIQGVGRKVEFCPARMTVRSA